MIHTVLLLVLVLTTIQATSLHHHCNSDVYLSASGMADDQQLTTLQHCLIDNCTIMRIDTGEQLDIIYTTQSHLVVTPTDGQTSMLISKNNPEVFCSTPNTSTNGQVITLIMMSVLALISGYIAVVHMLFKEIRGTFGKLMMLFNILTVWQCLNIIVSSITHNNITVHSWIPCYLLYFLYLESVVASEASLTSSLAYFAYVMYQSYKCIEVTPEINKTFYKYAITFVCSLSLLFGIFMVGFDFGTGIYKHTVLHDGHCIDLIQADYHITILVDAYLLLIEIIQMLILVTFFTYYYKLNKELKMVRDMANMNTQMTSLFLKIGITMAAAQGISQILFIYYAYSGNVIILELAAFSWIIEQSVIMLLFMCSEKVKRLCKARFCTSTRISP